MGHFDHCRVAHGKLILGERQDNEQFKRPLMKNVTSQRTRPRGLTGFQLKLRSGVGASVQVYAGLAFICGTPAKALLESAMYCMYF